MVNINLQQIYYFLKIAELESMNKASRELYVAQSSLSHAIKSLENYLGVTLLVRSSRGTVLTPDGKKFKEYATTIVKQMQLIGRMRDEEQSHHLSVSAYPALLNSQLVTKFYEKYGGTNKKIYIDEYRMERVIQSVSDAKTEIGLVQILKEQKTEVFRTFKEKKLDFYPLKMSTWYIAVRPEHPLAKKKEATMEELMEYPLVRARDDLYSSITTHVRVGEYSLDDLQTIFFANDNYTRIRLMHDTDAYSTTPSWNVEEYKQNGFAIINLKDCEIEATLGWIKRKKEELSANAQFFVTILEEYFSVKL